MKKSGGCQNLSLKYKISGITLIIAIVPLFVLSIIMSVLYNRAFEERSYMQIHENLQVISDRLEGIFADLVVCSNYLTIDINEIETNKELRPVDKDNMILSALNTTSLFYEGIESVVYIKKDETMYATNYRLYAKKDAILESQYLEKLKTYVNGKTVAFDYEADCMQTSEDGKVITMGKHIVRIGTGETLGYLFINVDVAELEHSMENEISSYFLFDGNRLCITEIPETEKGTPELTGERLLQEEDFVYEGDKYLIARKGLEEFDWTLVGVTNLSTYNVSGTALLRTLLIVFSVLVVLLVILGIWLTSMVTKPIILLSKGAEEIGKGNMDVEFHFKTEDEIGKLGSVFNRMTKQISGLLEKVDYEARKKREYELALVQEQVKPHFLYNTLDIILVLIEMNKTREAGRVTKKLADYYKNSLSSSEEIIPLGRELRIVEDYLDLQLMRYEDRFSYEIDADCTLEQVNVPKMMLQPLVENAIYHGLKYKEDWGTIKICVQKQENGILVEVADNGIGMTPERLEELSRLEKKPEGHFGVYSVDHRLKLYFGADTGLHFESVYGEGTRVTFYMPLER